MKDSKVPVTLDEKRTDASSEEIIGNPSEIYIEPEKKKACLGDLATLLSSTSAKILISGNINTFFFIFYLIFETPWVMAVNRFGPNKGLAAALVSCSAITILTEFIKNYHEAILVRILRGACEAGVVPGFDCCPSNVYL
ncbi:hypothetical protein BT63DRAFT_449614 [Microthyrium microscopicum]|uniref:Uncharacterized protein n=1 Tax=Microthyrium microscopicum TaxID=703497 RepID=A0A6A6UQR7_9PEZI|nr:hypothetical protein BT63DRAFT_449614 [Microthyrium microscopicum]